MSKTRKVNAGFRAPSRRAMPWRLAHVAIVRCGLVLPILVICSCTNGGSDEQEKTNPSNTATSGDPSSSEGAADPSRRDEINQFLSGLGQLPAAPPSHVEGASTPEELVVVNNPGSGPLRYDCKTTSYTLTANPDKIVTLNPDVGKMWLGGLLQGSGYAGGLGSLKALPMGKRAPLDIYVDLLDPDITRTVEAPQAAKVQSAIGELVTEAENKGTTVPTVAVFRQTTASSAEQGLLSLGFSAKYLSAKASGSFSYSQDVQQTTMMASLVQRYYTAAIVEPPTPADYFASDVTVDDFREQQELGRVGVGDPPVVVSSIAYGRMFIMNITSRASEEELSAAVSAAFSVAGNGAQIDLTARQKDVLREAKIEVISNGGEEADFQEAIRTGTVDGFLKRPSRITAARPISFQVDNLADGSAASFSETANYNLTTCKPRAFRAVTVGQIVKLTNFRVYAARCNQNVHGIIFVNGFPVVTIRDADPYLKVREASWAVPREDQVSWPKHFDWPNPSKYRYDPTAFAPDGYYLAIFNRPGLEGPTSAEFNVSGNLNNAIFPFRDDTANVYSSQEISPFAYGGRTLVGGSPKCPLNLSYEIQKVLDLVVDEQE